MQSKISTDYLNTTIIIIGIIQRLVFCLKHEISETGRCLRLQVELTQMGPIERAIPRLWTPATTPVGFIKPTLHKPPMTINIVTL
jgi:hypothetical protein